MKTRFHLIAVTISFIISSLFLTGCEDVKIFKDNIDPNALVGVKDTELKDDNYYVKNNTRF